MKGIVFRLLEDFVCELRGPDAWERILEAAPLETKEPFVGPGTYPDGDFMSLVKTATVQLEIPLPVAVRAFGRFSLPHLLRAVPGLTEHYAGPKELLLALDGTVHREVRKLWRDASPPRFVCKDAGPGALSMQYESARGLCGFLEGLLDGTAEYYAVPITWSHDACTHRGDPSCNFQLHFGEVARVAE